MSDLEDRSKSLANYDPARHKEHEDYRLTKFSMRFSNGPRTEFLIIPDLNSHALTLTDREAYARTMRVRSLYSYANRIIDPEKLANPKGIDGIALTVAITAGTIIYINILEIFEAKWSESDYPPAIAMLSGDGVIHGIEDIPAPAHAAMVIERLRPILVEYIKSDLSASWFVWRHIFFSVLYAIERDHGSLAALSGNDRERLFEQYKESGFSEAFCRAIYFCSQSYAAKYLESLNPSCWSIESLMGFLGYQAANDEDVNTEPVNMSPAQIHKLIETLQPDKDLTEVAYSFIGGKASLTINLPMLADLTEFSKAIESARVKQGGDRRPQWKKELWSDRNLQRYAQLVRSLIADWTWVKANYDPKFSKDKDEWLSEVRDRLRSSGLFHNCEKLTDDLLLRVTDTDLSGADREPLSLACLHAASELNIIEAYKKNNEATPPVQTLRKYYKHGLKLNGDSPV